MYPIRRFIWFFVLLLLAFPSCTAFASDDNISVIAGGMPLSLTTPPRVIGEKVFVPLELLTAVGASFHGRSGKRDGEKIRIIPSEGKAFTCGTRLLGGRSMLSIGDISEKLGIAVRWNEPEHTLSLRSIVRRIDFNGSELKVKTSCPVFAAVVDTKWTRSANKLVLDLKGAQFPKNRDDLKIRNTTQTPISTGIKKEDGETARIVLDLQESSAIKLVSAEKSSETIVSLNGSETQEPAPLPPVPEPPAAPPTESPESPAVTVTGLDFEKLSSHSAEIYVSSSGESNFFTSLSRNPFRLMLDISGATLGKDVCDIAVNHELLQRIHIEQKDAKTVRVTVGLSRVPNFDARWDPSASRFVIRLDLPKGAGGLLAQKVIVIDAGHGGFDTGAKGNTGECEKECTLQIAERVQELLAKAGACAIMTRKTDTYLTLQERVDVAVRHSADLFVSIHCNSCPVPNSISGIETFYHGHDANGAALAQCIHAEVIKCAGLPDRNVKSDTSRFKTGFAVLRGSSASGIPAVLIEVGFINNSADECKIIAPDYQERVAEAVVRGLKSYVEGNLQ